MTHSNPSTHLRTNEKKRASALGRNPFLRPKPTVAKKSRESVHRAKSTSTIIKENSPLTEWITDLESTAALAGLYLYCRLSI